VAEDFKRAYGAGKEAYEKKPLRWPFWVGLFVSLFTADRLTHHYHLSWPYHASIFFSSMLFVMTLIGLGRRFLRKSADRE
jgi:hypothetical protein